MEVEDLEKENFIKMTGNKEVKFTITEYKLETETFIAEWKIEKPEPNPFNITERHWGNIEIFKTKSRFTVFSLKSFNHYIFVLEQVKKGESNLDRIHYLWTEEKAKTINKQLKRI